MKKVKKNRLFFVRSRGDAEDLDYLEDEKLVQNRLHGIEYKERKKHRIISVIIFLIVAAAVAYSAFYYYKSNTADNPDRIKPMVSEGGLKDSQDARTLPEIKSASPALERGRKSFFRGSFNDALAEFEAVVESDASDEDKAAALTFMGIIYDDRGEYDRAIEFYRRALKYDDKNSIIYRNLSLAYRHMGDLEKAAEIIKEGIDLDSKNINNYILLGNILFENMDFAGAARQFEKALDISPDNPKALYNLALSLLKSGDEIRGIEYLKKAGEADKIGEAAHLAYSRLGVIYSERNDYELAEKYLRMAVSIAPNDPVDRYNLGIIYLNTGKHETALAELLRAEELGKRDSDLLENLGEAYFSLREYDRSIEAFKKLLSVNSRNIRILSRTAEIYYKNGDLDNAFELYKKIAVIDPVSENARLAYLNMGHILDDAKRYEEAADAYEKALSIAPGDASALYNLGIVYKHSGRGELAIDTWRKAADTRPDDPAPLMAIADYYYEKNLFDYAMDEYARIVRRWPDIQDAHFNIASIYYKKDMLDYSIEEYKKAIEINNRNDIARKSYINIGIILSGRKNEESLEEAYSSVQKALLLRPGDAEALSALGVIYIEKGNSEKAIDTFYQSISASSDQRLIAEGYNHIGKCYYKQGEYRKALQAFTRGIEAEPTFEDIRINRKVAMQAYEKELDR